MAGVITYIAPVDYGQGRIFGKKNKWTAVKRSSGNKQKGCAYGGDRNLAEHPIRLSEIQHRQEFAEIAKKVAIRRKNDSETYEQDVALFMAQKNQPGGYPTFQKWLFHDEMSKL